MAMTGEQRLHFLRGIRADSRQYKHMLATIDVEKSECSRHSDRESIHEGIRSSVGFGPLSRLVFGVLEEWMRGQIEAQAFSCAEAGQHLEAMQWNESLGMLLQDQGQPDKALVIQERLLQLKRRSLSKNDPSLGIYHFAIAIIFIVTCFFVSTCSYDHDQPCRILHCTRKASGCCQNARRGAADKQPRAACKP